MPGEGGGARLELTEPLFYHDDGMQLMGSCNNNNNDRIRQRQNRIREKAWLNVFTSPQRIIPVLKWWIDTLFEGNLDMELNCIHVKYSKKPGPKLFYI